MLRTSYDADADSDDDVKLKELRVEFASRRREMYSHSNAGSGLDSTAGAAEKSGVVSRIAALRNSLTDKMKKAAAARRKPNSANPLDVPSRAAGVDLDVLRDIKAVFDDVGDDGDVGVAEDEFVRIFGPALCPGMDSAKVRCWFRGIDGDCSRHVSWNEIGDFITRYTETDGTDDADDGDGAALLEQRRSEALGTKKRYVSTQLEGACHRHPAHAGTVASALYMPSTDSLFSVGSDNVVRNWNPVTLQANLAPVHVGTSWIVGMAPIVQGSRLCIFETNRVVTMYNISTAKSNRDEEGDAPATSSARNAMSPRGADTVKKTAEKKVTGVAASSTTEFCRAFASPGPHTAVGDSGLPVVNRYINAKHHVLGDLTHGVVTTPATLLESISKKTTAADHLRTLTAGELVAMGDEEGSVDLHLLHQSDTPLPPVSRLLCHTTWVTKLKAALEYDAILTSSTDGNVILTHIEKGHVIQSLTPQMGPDGKRKPVFTFDASPTHHLLAYSTGRTVHVWSTTTGVCHAKLTEHDVAVTHVAVNGYANEIVALQADKTIKVWDTRMWRVVDVLVDKKTRQPEDVLSTVLCLPHRGMIVSGSSSLVAWRSLDAQELFDSGSKDTLPLGGGRSTASLREDIVVAAQATANRGDGDEPESPQSPSMSPGTKDLSGGTTSGTAAVSTVRHLQPIIAMHVAVRSGLIIVMDLVKTIVWSLADSAPLTQWLWPLPGNSATATFFDSSELRVLVGTDEGQVWWLNASSGHLIRQLRHTLPRCEVTTVANFETVIPALTAAGIGPHIALWVDDNNGRKLPDAPSTVLSAPPEYGVVLSLMRPLDNSNAIVVATASGVTAVFNFVTKALMYSIPPPAQLGTAEYGVSLRRATAFIGHSNGTMRVFALERDTLCVSVAYFAAASMPNESITSAVLVHARTGVAFGDTAGRISVFRLGGLIVDRDLVTKIIPARLEGRQTERDVVDTHVDLTSCWNAHDGQPITALEYIPHLNRLLSAGSDRTVRIWDVEHIRLLGELGHSRPKQSVLDHLPPPGEGPDFSNHPFVLDVGAAQSQRNRQSQHSHRNSTSSLFASGRSSRGPPPPSSSAVVEIDYGVTLPTPQSRREPSHALLRATAEGLPTPTTTSTLLPYLLQGRDANRAATATLLQHNAGSPAAGRNDTVAAARPFTTPQPGGGSFASLLLASPNNRTPQQQSSTTPLAQQRTDSQVSRTPIPALVPDVTDAALLPPASLPEASHHAHQARRTLRTPAAALGIPRPHTTQPSTAAESVGAAPAILAPIGRRRYTKEDVDALINAAPEPQSRPLQSHQATHQPQHRGPPRLGTAVSFVGEPAPTTTNVPPPADDDWRTHDLLSQVARRTRALRRDLPQIDTPLTSSAIRSTLGEVARIKQSRDTETLDTMKASGGGGFRGLELPAFQIGNAKSKKR